jgi:flagellar secretion chaperone FliS
MNISTALRAYQDVNIESGITGASPHRLIVLLLEGSLDRLTSAEGAIEQGDIGKKGEMISSVISIIDNLRASIDLEKGGEIASNLASLYDYMESRLVSANMDSDVTIVQEVKNLLKEVSTAWSQIPEELRNR